MLFSFAINKIGSTRGVEYLPSPFKFFPTVIIIIITIIIFILVLFCACSWTVLTWILVARTTILSSYPAV